MEDKLNKVLINYVKKIDGKPYHSYKSPDINISFMDNAVAASLVLYLDPEPEVRKPKSKAQLQAEKIDAEEELV